MTYGIGITFPTEPSKEDIKKLKRDIAYSRFGVVDGGKESSSPSSMVSGEYLDRHGEMLGLPRREGETDDEYRVRLRDRLLTMGQKRR